LYVLLMNIHVSDVKQPVAYTSQYVEKIGHENVLLGINSSKGTRHW